MAGVCAIHTRAGLKEYVEEKVMFVVWALVFGGGDSSKTTRFGLQLNENA